MFLRWKVWAFVAGSGLAVGGMATKNEWLLRGAVATLLAGLALRFAGRWRARTPSAAMPGTPADGRDQAENAIPSAKSEPRTE